MRYKKKYFLQSYSLILAKIIPSLKSHIFGGNNMVVKGLKRSETLKIMITLKINVKKSI